jgi:hypothetical protein
LHGLKLKKGFEYKVVPIDNGYKCGLSLLEKNTHGEIIQKTLKPAIQNPITSEICR